MKHWIAAFRLKTLPLALGAIIIGSSLQKFSFRFEIFLFAASTAILLQILSNLANDYGDYKKGTDSHRADRQLAGGNISPRSMLVAIVLFVLLALASGIYLLHISFANNWKYWWIFFGIGLLSILAAIAYTVGKKAYGYNGLGDVFVFIFFGIVGVLGTAFLFKQDLTMYLWFPAIAYGCLCVGVLNVNNIRDLDKDILTNKITIAAKLGKSGAISYQIILLVSATIALIIHHFVTGYLSLAPLALIALAFTHIKALRNAESADEYNQQLKYLSLGSLAVAIIFILPIYV
jgi:1,4-dihydroxy-2-naphthoate octaprenyltransferase